MQEEITNKILNKVFKEAIYAGYDANDVDSFFDEVINYIKHIQLELNNSNKKIICLTNEINELEKGKNKLIQQITIKSKKIIQLEQEGYGNVHFNTKFKLIDEWMAELKNDILKRLVNIENKLAKCDKLFSNENK